jgi:predicted amidohydrolase YtcJ
MSIRTPVSAPLVVRNVRLDGVDVDLRLRGTRIEALAPALGHRPGDLVLDAGGRHVHVGLHDHHVHLRALAAASGSVAVGPTDLAGPAELAQALREAAGRTAPGGWVRAAGYHESVAGPLDRALLDEMVQEVPIRVQHRSGELWIVNSRGLEHAELDGEQAAGVERDAAGRATGRLWRLDRLLEGRWPVPPTVELRELSTRAATLGVTGITDATPGRADEETEALRSAVVDGEIAQRVLLMVRPDAPHRSPAVDGLVADGPVKVLLDDLTLPGLDELASVIAGAHQAGRPVAIHCVTRPQFVLAIAALDTAGPSGADRIEHGAVIPAELIGDLKRLEVTVVTQPNFVAERGEAYLSEVDPVDRVDLWRAGSLVAMGVRIAIGTDAPFGGLDPWRAAQAAVERSTSSGQVLGAAEVVPAVTALGWLSGFAEAPWRSRRIEPGAPADLIVLDSSAEAAVSRGRGSVAATIVAGRVVHGQELLR